MMARSRNFAAMDAGRVRVMAQRQFQRPFLDKSSAVAALATLPAEKQATLKKPGKVTPAMLTFRPIRDKVTGSVLFYDAQRGGIAPPSAERLARAATTRPEALQRYARAVLNLQAKSAPQALVLLGKYATATDVKKAASAAYGLAELYKPAGERTGIRINGPASAPGGPGKAPGAPQTGAGGLARAGGSLSPKAPARAPGVAPGRFGAALQVAAVSFQVYALASTWLSSAAKAAETPAKPARNPTPASTVERSTYQTVDGEIVEATPAQARAWQQRRTQ